MLKFDENDLRGQKVSLSSSCLGHLYHEFLKWYKFSK